MKQVERYEQVAQWELKFQAVIEGVRLEKYPKITAATQALRVPPSTVYHRINGRKSRSHAHEHQQQLTRNQESSLCGWIKELAANGYPPRYPQVHQMAEEIRRYGVAEILGKDIDHVNDFPFGKDCVRKSFLPHHPDLQSVTSAAIGSNRVKDASEETLQRWFDEFVKVIEKYEIEGENIYNMDESGFCIGTMEATRVIISATARTRWQAQPGRQEWVSVVECISADGTAISPLVIFKGQNVSRSWVLNEVADDGQLSATAKG
jgi:hypothetical protein